jgi:hypothetical protein
MGTVTDLRYIRQQRERERAFLREWLGTLPRGGWTGAVPELWLVLEEYRTRPGTTWLHMLSIPFSSGLSRMLMFHEHIIRTAGWSVAFTRTAKARCITFTRSRVRK